MLYFVRHGSTDWNENRNSKGEKDPKFQGRADLSLNEKGIMQAQMMAEQLKDVWFDRVICSPLVRAVQTCRIIYKGNIPIEIDDRLVERDFGEFEGKTRSEFGDKFEDFCNRYSKQKYQAESIESVERRVFSLLDELQKQPNKNILIVSHGGVGCVFVSYFKGVPQNGDYTNFLLPHGKPLVLDFNDLTKTNSCEKK